MAPLPRWGGGHHGGEAMSNTRTFKPGDRVYVLDPGLAELRAIMRRYGHEPTPNHHGTVHEIEDGMVEIWFDNEDGPGLGQASFYPHDEVRHLTEDES